MSLSKSSKKKLNKRWRIACLLLTFVAIANISSINTLRDHPFFSLDPIKCWNGFRYGYPGGKQ